MTVVEHDGRIVVVDTGLMFPTAEMLGIDLVLPDFSYLRDRADDDRGDRPHPRPRGPRRGAALRAARDRHAAGDLRRAADDRPRALEARGAQAPRRAARRCSSRASAVEAGPFEIEMIHMSHSIPDARAVALHTDLGDDPGHRRLQASTRRRSTAGPPTSPGSPSSAREGVLCLCGDSTNADRPGVAPSESTVGPALLDVVLALRGPDHRHLLRLQRPPRAAGDRRRRPARPPGRARRPLDAQELQHRLQPRDRRRALDGLLISPKEIEDFPDHKVIAISTGSQGEPLSALRRMALQRPSRRRAALRRHGDLLGDADPRQRALGERDDRPHLRDRRPGRDRRRRADPRLRPRLAARS